MASDYDITQAAAAVYAQALLELASGAGQEAPTADELDSLNDLWQREPGFAALMSTPTIDRAARTAIVRKLFEGRVSPLVFNLLRVMTDKHRALLFPAVCAAYRQRLEEQQGRQRVSVASAIALTNEQRNALATELERLTGRKPILLETVDRATLGGLRVQVGDRVFDTTLRTRLRRLATELHGKADAFVHAMGSRVASTG